MPVQYVKLYMTKSKNISWEEYTTIVNKEYMNYQLQQIKERKKEEEKHAVEEKQRKEQEEREQQHLRQLQEEQEKQRKADEAHRKREEEARVKQALLLKQEQEKAERVNARKQFQSILPGMSSQSTSNTSQDVSQSIRIKEEMNGASTVANPFGTMPRKPNSVDERLVRIGELIIDEDVELALESLKTVGSTIHKALEKTNPGGIDNSSLARKLFDPELNVDDDAKIDDGSLLPVPTDDIKKENETSFSSPQPKLFQGMRCITEETFKAKIKTPGRSTPVGSPRNPKSMSSLDLYKAQADTKSKVADQGNTYPKRKKVNEKNMKPIFDLMRAKKREIVDFTMEKNSVYAIMAFYCDSVGTMDDEKKVTEMKNHLYNFCMKNHEYIKVIVLV